MKADLFWTEKLAWRGTASSSSLKAVDGPIILVSDRFHIDPDLAGRFRGQGAAPAPKSQGIVAYLSLHNTLLCFETACFEGQQGIRNYFYLNSLDKIKFRKCALHFINQFLYSALPDWGGTFPDVLTPLGRGTGELAVCSRNEEKETNPSTGQGTMGSGRPARGLPRVPKDGMWKRK